jgi:peroxiredoxin
LRDEYEAIADRGAEVVAVGTGDASYARSFIADTGVPFPVLVDDSGAAAEAASVRKSGLLALVGPGAWAKGSEVWRAGHHVHRPGKRVTQLGATFVIGPGPHLHYEHLDAEPWDHAPVGDVLGALPA